MSGFSMLPDLHFTGGKSAGRRAAAAARGARAGARGDAQPHLAWLATSARRGAAGMCRASTMPIRRCGRWGISPGMQSGGACARRARSNAERRACWWPAAPRCWMAPTSGSTGTHRPGRALGSHAAGCLGGQALRRGCARRGAEAGWRSCPMTATPRSIPCGVPCFTKTRRAKALRRCCRHWAWRRPVRRAVRRPPRCRRCGRARCSSPAGDSPKAGARPTASPARRVAAPADLCAGLRDGCGARQQCPVS